MLPDENFDVAKSTESKTAAMLWTLVHPAESVSLGSNLNLGPGSHF